MSKNEILAEIKHEVLSIPSNQIQQGAWTTEELNNAIVAAYNRAIDDSIGKLNEQAIPFIELGIDAVKKLKI